MKPINGRACFNFRSSIWKVETQLSRLDEWFPRPQFNPETQSLKVLSCWIVIDPYEPDPNANRVETVLVTGSSGKIGQAVVRELLQRGHQVVGLDPVSKPIPQTLFQGDLSNIPLLRKAMHGVSCLIHLAATPDDADFQGLLLPNNLVGVHNLFECARDARIPRILLASSGQVNWWQQHTGPFPIQTTDPISPKSWYAATKVFMEAAGRSYSEQTGRTVISIRLGWCPRPGQEREIAESDWAQNVYLSPGDAGRFFALAVETNPLPAYSVLFATSRPRHRAHLDLSPSQSLLGYTPQDTWPQGLES